LGTTDARYPGIFGARFSFAAIIRLGEIFRYQASPRSMWRRSSKPSATEWSRE